MAASAHGESSSKAQLMLLLGSDCDLETWLCEREMQVTAASERSSHG